MTDPRWMQIARNELGVKEKPGKVHEPRILEYHSETRLHAAEDETAWCSSFVNWCLKQCGIEGTREANARSWLHWSGGERCEPKIGAIAVLWRGAPVGWKGHVGFIERIEPNTLWLLGGNQGDKVSVAAYPKHRLLGCRWPVTKENENA
jgi:uncharacterized protein (TIGR02594 family)